MNNRTTLWKILLVSLIGVFLITACQQEPSIAPQPTAIEIDSIDESIPTATPVPPSTEIPPTAAVTSTHLPTLTNTPTIEPTATKLNNTTSIIIQRDIEFSVTDGEQKLDAYFPVRTDNLSPVILMLHQGGGSKEQYMNWGRDFAEEGYTVIASNFRDWQFYKYPTGLLDTYCGLSWIIENADKYDLDINHIYVLGHSAGGTNAGLIGVIENPSKVFDHDCVQNLPSPYPINGVVTFTGIFDYEIAQEYSKDLQNYSEKLLGATFTDEPDLWRFASATSWVTGNEPPFLLIHGENDENILPEQSKIFADLLTASGVSNELIIVPGGNHGTISGSNESYEIVLGFLQSLISK